ncbi:DMT family transporter [Desulfosediminicola flagellatus]|uniref:DMT family transporter n=1 Tax=Desulfosediminicola flagellatus TaxID=2569541 RepID=UPI0010AB8C57|nr:DMT family transporter [Desulfosediminicola flagellatus]
MKSSASKHTEWQIFAIGIGLLSAFLFGLATPASKILLGNLNPFLLAGLLYLGAAIGVTPLVARERTLQQIRPKVSRRQYLYIAGTVLCGGFLGPTLLLFGLKAAHASSVAIWLNMELVATAIIGALLFDDHLDRNGWFGVCLALAAGLVMTISEGSGGLLAALMVTAACFSWGFDNHFTALIDCMTPSQITLIKGVIAGSVNVAIGLSLDVHSAEFLLVAKALILGAVSYGASIVLYVMAAQQIGATRSQILFSSSPFFGVGLAAILLGEQIHITHIGAICCLTGAIFFSNRVKHEHNHIHSDLNHTHLHNHDDDHHDHEHDNPEANGPHSHAHQHQKITHSHPHYPDIHHRHEHQS